MRRGALIWIVVTVVVSSAAGILVFGPFVWSNERVQQAGVAGIVIALGWFAGFVLRETSALIVRHERLRDVHRALRAEITHYLKTLGDVAYLTRERDDMLERMEGAEAYVPFIPRERNDAVFRAIVGEIHLLPRSSVGPVVAYYSQITALETMIEDLRGEAFKALTPTRRGAVYGDFMGLKLRALEYGDQAIDLIDTYTDKGAKAAERRYEEFLKAETAFVEGREIGAADRRGHEASVSPTGDRDP